VTMMQRTSSFWLPSEASIIVHHRAVKAWSFSGRLSMMVRMFGDVGDDFLVAMRHPFCSCEAYPKAACRMGRIVLHVCYLGVPGMRKINLREAKSALFAIGARSSGDRWPCSRVHGAGTAVESPSRKRAPCAF